MNNKLVMGIIVLVLVVGGLFVMTKNQTQTNQTPTTSVESETEKSEDKKEDQQEADAEKKNEATVEVTENGFDPASVTVKVGAEVEWENKTNATANVSSDDHPTHKLYPLLNLGSFDKGKSVSVVFDKAGTYTYHNHLSPSMTGTVVVE